MKLRTRFTLMLALLSVAIIAAAVVTARIVLVRHALQQDEQRARDALERGRHVLKNERDSLLAIVSAWASWDDTHEFMADGNDDFLDSNFVEGTLRKLQVNLLLCLDMDGKTAAMIALDADEQGTDDVPGWLAGALKEGNLIERVVPDKNVAGFIHDNENLWLVATAPILTSEDEGPCRGVLLMARLIDERERQKLARLVHYSMIVWRVDPCRSTNHTCICLRESNKLVTCTAVPDAFNDESMVMQLTMPRVAYMQANVSIMYFAGWIALCGIAVTLLAFWAMNRWVLSRVSESVDMLKSGVDSAMESGHSDEMDDLVDAVGLMLGRMDEAQKEVVERKAEAVEAQKLAALGMLIAGVAHEVNNPNSIVSFNMKALEHLLDKIFSGTAAISGIGPDLQEESRQVVQETLAASNRIAEFVASLKAFAQPAADSVKKLVDVNAAVTRATEWLRYEMDKRGCKLTLELRSDLPDIKGNAQQIAQVLVNLIQNACNAVERGSAPIAISTAYDEDAETVTIVVEDKGPGIPAEDIARVTDPFFTTRRSQGGSGLGLSICAAITKAHSGTLDIVSASGEGTCVTVALPVAEKEVADG